jgi:hypothetical protein
VLWKNHFQGGCNDLIGAATIHLFSGLFPLKMTYQHACPTCVWVDRQTRSTVQNVIIHRDLRRAHTFLMHYQ